jgi:hypothetical protein
VNGNRVARQARVHDRNQSRPTGIITDVFVGRQEEFSGLQMIFLDARNFGAALERTKRFKPGAQDKKSTG